MNIKVLAIFGAIAYGAWFFLVGGKQVKEAHVYDLYNQYMVALAEEDDTKMCDLFADNVTGRFSTPSNMPINQTLNKASACQSVAAFYAIKSQIEKTEKKQMHANFEYDVNSISISPDKKTATVEVLIETRIGTAEKAYMDVRSTQTDTIKRHLGKAQVERSDGTIRFY